MTTRRVDETDDEWQRRLRVAPLRDAVRVARDAHESALFELRKHAWRARYVTTALVVGVIALLTIVGVVVAELWLDGLAPLLPLAIPVAVLTLFGGMICTDEYERRADRRHAVVRELRVYREAYNEFLDAGGSYEVNDALLAPPDVTRR